MISNGVLWIFVFAHLYSISLFLKGYFPPKLTLPGVSSKVALPSEPHGDPNDTLKDELLSPVVGRTVIILIDALRADFIFHEKHFASMPFVHDMLIGGQGVGFVAKAHPPTVTLPRIKALVTGTNPGFVDVIWNFGSDQLTEDSLIHQAVSKGSKIIFYGDDLWMRLFPSHFIRSEGTTSFFVNDFYEVDRNVTRQLDSELQRKDWNIMILHYLGLDHIGHVKGPTSHLVHEKLREMDDVIRAVYSSLLHEDPSNEPPLVVVCGDHGMSDAGSHGGSTAAEINVPVVYLSTLFNNDTEVDTNRKHIFQIDIAPTLSGLLGLPIPKNNIGKVTPSLFSSFSWRKRLYLMYWNAHQVIHVAQNFLGAVEVDLFENVREKHGRWLQNRCHQSKVGQIHQVCPSASDILFGYTSVIEQMRELLTLKSTRYDTYALICATFIQWMVFLCVASIVITFLTCHDHCCVRLNFNASSLCYAIGGLLLVHWLLCLIFVDSNCCLCQMSLTGILSAGLLVLVLTHLSSVLRHSWFYILFDLRFVSSKLKKIDVHIFLLITLILHSLSLSSSSFVEEEHQTWYFFTLTAFLLLLLNSLKERNDSCPESLFGRRIVEIFVLIGLLRITQRWNATGDKWAHLPDIGDWLNESSNKFWLSLSCVGGLLVIVFIRSSHHSLGFNLLLAVCAILIYVYRGETGVLWLPENAMSFLPESAVTARITYGVLAIFFFSNILKKSDSAAYPLHSIVTFWIFLSALLLRPHNVPLLAITVFQEIIFANIVKKCHLPVAVSTLLTVYLAQGAFFQQGNSNSLARIDLAGGYIGLTTYNSLLVAVMLLCSTYSLPIFWFLSLSCTLYIQDNVRYNDHLAFSTLLILLCRTFAWAFYCLDALALRYHLFVWSVFSPKLLYEAATSVIILLIIIYFQVASRLTSKFRKNGLIFI